MNGWLLVALAVWALAHLGPRFNGVIVLAAVIMYLFVLK